MKTSKKVTQNKVSNRQRLIDELIKKKQRLQEARKKFAL
jgi:hypothetical protein